jgi:hypothetical protein
MDLAAELRDVPAPLAALAFCWDPETEILSGRSAPPGASAGFTGSVELESPEGAVVLLEAVGGVLSGVEVVVWPELARRAGLVAPHDAKAAQVVLTGLGAAGGVVELESAIAADVTLQESLIHLRFGHAARTVKAADNLLVDLDARAHVAGLWLLRVPPLPGAP